MLFSKCSHKETFIKMFRKNIKHNQKIKNQVDMGIKLKLVSVGWARRLVGFG